MANAVVMPKAGITVESCIIGKWLKKVGDPVAIGDILFSYETDKAAFECESTAEGELLEIFFQDGDEVPCLTNVCAIGTKGEDVSALRPGGETATPAESAPAPAASAPAAAPAPAKSAAPVPQHIAAVVMPKAGITVESCIIGKWEKKIGDQIKVGDILFSYETDKASFECESTAEGELIDIFFQDGDEVPCLTNVCVIGQRGEDYSALRPDGDAVGAEAASAPAQTAPAAVAAPAATTAPAGKTAISPRARKVAEHAGVDAALATPTGPKGRIIERDVRKLLAEGVPAAAAAPVQTAAPAQAAAAPAAPAAAEAEYEDVKFSGIRRAISKSMHTSLSTMAQLTHNFSFDATEILQYRKQLKAAGEPYDGITIGDIVLYAVSRTVLSCPDLNAHMLDDNNIRLFKHVNLGVAVDTPRGLMVPTIFQAETKSLLEISKEVKDLAAQARSGSISPDLLSGGTFTVTNLGSFGVESFTPVINPPQTGILGVCTTVQRPRQAADGSIQLYPAMGLSLTYDHRAVDGAPASRFMKQLCSNLEHFTVLLSK